ncbi:MAG: YfhO family protein [Planctomycetes bacterium]|nr:YfhO family protein [Planctomycetota bacterium]
MPRAPRRLAALALAALALVPALPALRGDALLVGRDLIAYGHARGAALGEAWRQGDVPRWNPHAHHGASWWGPRAGGVVYPANALFAGLPPGLAAAWFVALHLALAVEGARRLARRDLPAAPAAAAGLAYGLSGFVLSTHWNLPFLASAALLPWAGVAGRLARDRPRRGAALVGAVVALCLLAAEPQGALIAAGLACALAARGGRRALAWSAAGVALAGLAAGPQVLSILHELPDTDRALGPADARFSLAARALALGLVAPGALGEHAALDGGYWGHALWDGTLPYCAPGVGALGLAAVVTAVARARGAPAARAGLALVVVGVGLAALDPGAALGLRFPAKWLVLSGLGLALLVGAGARAIAAGHAAPARLTLALLLAASLPLALALAGPAPDLEAWLAAQGPGEVLGPVARAATAEALARVAAAAALGLAAVTSGRGLPRARAAALLLGALALDLGLTALPAVRTTTAPLLARPPLVDALDPRPGAPPPRYFSRGRMRAPLAPPADGLTPWDRDELLAAAVLEGSRASVHGVRAIDAFETVHPLAFDRLARDPRLAALPAAERWGRLDAAWLPATPAEVARAGGAWAPGPELVPGLVLVENRACPPWAYLVAAATPAADLDAAIAATCDPDRRPARLVVLGPEGAALAGPGSPGPGGEVLAVEFAPERLRIRMRAAGPAWLVVREAFSRDWSATLDGAPVEVARADVLFRAVAVPPGEHAVVMVHAPAWWTPGLALGALGWAGLTALALVRRRA